jgi:putative transposase
MSQFLFLDTERIRLSLFPQHSGHGQRNAVRAKLVERAEEWRWSSLFQFKQNGAGGFEFLTQWPMERPQNWIEVVNAPDNASQLDDLRTSAQRGRPFGSADWITVMAKQLGLGSTLHARGRPKRTQKDSRPLRPL